MIIDSKMQQSIVIGFNTQGVEIFTCVHFIFDKSFRLVKNFRV